MLLGTWALYQAIYAQSILQKMLYAYTIYSAALTPVVLAAFYSKRVTAWGAVAAIGSGTVVTLAWDFEAFPALAAALISMVAVSLVTPKPSAEQLAKFAD